MLLFEGVMLFVHRVFVLVVLHEKAGSGLAGSGRGRVLQQAREVLLLDDDAALRRGVAANAVELVKQFHSLILLHHVSLHFGCLHCSLAPQLISSHCLRFLPYYMHQLPKSDRLQKV